MPPATLKTRRSRWLLAGAAAAVALAAALFWLQRTRLDATDAALLARLPAGDAVLLRLDLAALRKAGLLDLLSRVPVAEEPDYRAFVRGTGFDYKTDLDAALAAFHSSGTFFFVRGRFNWKRLSDYSRARGGACSGGFCQVPGSTPERRISFFPLRSGLMALAVSRDEAAARRLDHRPAGSPAAGLPPYPVWLSIPPAALKSGASFPSAARLLLGSMEEARNVLLALAPQGDRLEVLLEVQCRSGEQAAALIKDLEMITSTLRELVGDPDATPGAAGLAGLLTSGRFSADAARVTGRWPVTREFIERAFSSP